MNPSGRQSTLRLLAAQRQRAHPSPLDSPQVLWGERVVVCTGPQTYRITIPVAGSELPPEIAAHALGDLRQACEQLALVSATKVRAVVGRVVADSRYRSRLVVFVTTDGAADDPFREAAHLSDAVREAGIRWPRPNGRPGDLR